MTGNLLGQPACSYGSLPGYWAQKPNSTVGTWTLLDDQCQLQVILLSPLPSCVNGFHPQLQGTLLQLPFSALQAFAIHVCLHELPLWLDMGYWAAAYDSAVLQDLLTPLIAQSKLRRESAEDIGILILGDSADRNLAFDVCLAAEKDVSCPHLEALMAQMRIHGYNLCCPSPSKHMRRLTFRLLTATRM